MNKNTHNSSSDKNEPDIVSFESLHKGTESKDNNLSDVTNTLSKSLFENDDDDDSNETDEYVKSNKSSEPGISDKSDEEYETSDSTANASITKNIPDKNTRIRNHLLRSGIIMSIIIAFYLTFVYSSIPVVAKWRNIYIETAMTTNSHQWLATWFIPKSIIDDVMKKYAAGKDEQKGLSSSWDDVSEEDFRDSDEYKSFFEQYWELESDSFIDYLKQHEDLIKDGYKDLLIEDLDNKLKLKTTEGDDLLVLDVPNNLIIVGVSGSSYQGKLAIVKNSKQVTLAKATSLGSFGQEINTFCDNNDAILGINASGFVDPDGEGSGAEVKGCIVIDGVDYASHHEEPAWKFFGVKKDEHMYITNYALDIEKDYRWAMEFYPALIIDGESVVDGTYGMGIQPRSTIGQTKTGDMLLLIVDGRQTHSLGCTVEDCANIMLRYNAYQGMNLDGGSSSVMYYKDQFITSSSSVTGRGRYMPDAIIVKKASDVSDTTDNDDDSEIINSQPASSVGGQ